MKHIDVPGVAESKATVYFSFTSSEEHATMPFSFGLDSEGFEHILISNIAPMTKQEGKLLHW